MPTRFDDSQQTNQPQEGFEPSAAALEAGLVFAAIPGYPTRNLVNNKARVSTVAGGIAQSTGYGGVTWNSSTSTPSSDRYDLAPGAAYTLVAIVVDDAGAGTLRSFACADDGSLVRALQFRISASNVVELIGFNTGVSAFTATGPSSTNTTKPVVAVGTLGTDKVLRAYLNGITGTSATITSTVQTFTVIDLLARVSSGAATNGFPGRLLGFFAFNRELPPNMVRERFASAEAAWGFLCAPAALPVVVAAGGSTVAVGQATETDTAQPVATAQALTVGQAAESDTAQPVSVLLPTTVGQAQETDAAQPLSVLQSKAVGQAQETDAALAAAASQALAVGQAQGTDTAQPVSAYVPGVIGQALETDTAQPLQVNQAVAVVQAQETDTALAAAAVTGILAGMALEIDTAFAVAVLQARGVGQVLETDTAQPVTLGSSGGVGSAADVWNYVLSNGLTAEQNVVGIYSMLQTLVGAPCPTATDVADAVWAKVLP